MIKNTNLIDQEFQRYHEISEVTWKAIDYLDHKSAFYYLSCNLSEEKIRELCSDINVHEIMVAMHLKSIHWDSKQFQEYRMMRWGQRREEYKEKNLSLSSGCDGVANYLYRLSEGDLPKDRPSLGECFEEYFSQPNGNSST